MAALHATKKQDNDFLKIRGMVLLAPAGCQPHRVLRPRESEMMVDLLRWNNPMVSTLTSYFVKAIYTKLLGFPSDAPPGHQIAGLVRAATTDFNVVREQVEILRSLKLPSLIAWSQNDEFMEEVIPVELGQLCHPCPRLAFAGGGHNVQKTRAEEIAGVMSKWIEDVIAWEGEGEPQTTQKLP